MKKVIKITLILSVLIVGLKNTKAQPFNSLTTTGTGASAFGKYCNSTGIYSLSSGYDADATGAYGISLGVRTRSTDKHAVTIGIDLQATANRSVVIGSGTSTGADLVNNIPQSLMIGFNSALPTFFVGGAPSSTTIGKVGIGTSTPSERLDVNGTIKTSKGWGDWFQMHTTNGNGFWRVHNPQSQKYLVFGWDDGSASDQSYSLHMHQNGSISIGTHDPKGYKLAVKGNMIAEEIVVKLSTNWPDFVFEKKYGLMELEEVESYINENAHLPNVPSAKEIEKGGVNLGEMDAVLLQKIEELTLYIIEMNNQLKTLSTENGKLQDKLKELEQTNN